MSEENAGPSAAGAPGDRENAQASSSPVRDSRPNRAWLGWLVWVIALVSLFAPLSASGIWDPPEREVAELARRIALNLLGGHDLALAGADNEVPTRSELGRGELPFSSIAVGFRLFGLHEWAGRLPLALWGLTGLLATYWLVRRLCDRRAAGYAVLALSTMPLYFLHARTMLGDIVTMAALALAVCGLGLAVFDRGRSQWLGFRYLALAAGALGSSSALLSRGVLLGVAVPAASVGFVWIVLRSARVISKERFGDVVGMLTLGVGLAALIAGSRALARAPESAGPFSLLLGSVVNRPRALPTFDGGLLQLGHALFPWSAFLPVALGTLLRAPSSPDPGEREREAALRALTLTAPVIAYAACGLAAPVLGSVPFPAVFAFAIAVALFTRDQGLQAEPSRSVPMVVCAFAILLLGDFRNFPDKALSAFGVADVHLPESFRASADQLLTAGTAILCAMCFFLMQECSTHGDSRFQLSEYRVWPSLLQKLWAGNLSFALLVLECALLGLFAIGWLGNHVPAFSILQGLGSGPSAGALLGALLLPAALALPLAALAVRDAFRTLFDPELGSAFGKGLLARAIAGGFSRAPAALGVATAFGLCLSLVFYPKLALQISPKQVFDKYRLQARPGEELGMLGTGAASASYYAGGNVPAFETPARAFDWLMGTGNRRWLVIRDTDLATLNALYRAQRSPASNLPVLDADSSEILLVSNQLGGLHNDNPLAQYVLDEAPRPSRVLDANLGDELDVLGWDVLDREGHAVDAVEPGRHYTFVIFYRVARPVTGTWETFIHIDGFQRRFNGDHPTLDGRYPFSLWRGGDFIADRKQFSLEPNFAAGKYRVYFGLFNGNRRLEVRRGVAVENRLEAGFIQVR